MGRAYNVITNDELKGLSFIPSHELVSWHIHKLRKYVVLFFLRPFYSRLYEWLGIVFSLITGFLLGSWGVTAHHNRLFEHRGEGRGGYFKGKICRGWMLQVEERFD